MRPALLGAAFLLFTSSVRAADKPQQQTPDTKPAATGATLPDLSALASVTQTLVDDFASVAAERYGLDANQKDLAEALFEDRAAEAVDRLAAVAEALSSAGSASDGSGLTDALKTVRTLLQDLRALEAETVQDFRDLLTPEQQALLDADLSRHGSLHGVSSAHRKDRGDGSSGSSADTSGSSAGAKSGPSGGSR
jgi:Spy/CpxP family protein refolding chaperone